MPRDARARGIAAVIAIAIVAISPVLVVRTLTDDAELIEQGAIGRVEVPHPAGPHAVRRDRYDVGARSFTPTDFDRAIELAGVVHAPVDISEGPFPIVLLMHGYTFPCERAGETAFAWPCPEGYEPIPSNAGYDDLASRLASWGFVVVSVSANGLNVAAFDEDDVTGMRGRGELLEAHLELWAGWSRSAGGPFGARFTGNVDLSRVGVAGHSRGGEGAIWQVLVDRARADPFGTDAVLAIAPSDLTGRTLTDVPLGVVVPTCDGDLDDLQGVSYVDRARYPDGGNDAPVHQLTITGANHKFFNSVWSPGSGHAATFDDTIDACADPLTQDEQRNAAAAYAVSFFRRYVGGDRSGVAVWEGTRPAPGAGSVPVLVSTVGEDPHRVDLADMAEPGDLRRHHLGGAVAATGLETFRWCGGGGSSPCPMGGAAPVADGTAIGPDDVHGEGVGRALIGWDGPASLSFEIPERRGDLSNLDSVAFRVAVTRAPANAGLRTQDLGISLVDASGGTATVFASDVDAGALAAPAERVLLQEVRVPLAAFDGVDLSDVRELRFDLSLRPSGELAVADVAFWRSSR